MRRYNKTCNLMPEPLNPDLNGVAETLLLSLLGPDCCQLTPSGIKEAASVIAEAFSDETHPPF
jgi:hypothetical protein